MQLDRLGRGAHGEFGCEELGHGGLCLVRLAILLEPRCVIQEVLGRLDLGLHVGEGEMHALE